MQGMTMKPHVTRTFAPLQFEALEPHRFEDLVRDLLYGYRDWQRIEATGRGGGDDGFDARAYEKAANPVERDPDVEDEVEEPTTVEGNLWMIQCKREKQLGAARITAIIDEAVKKESPPYGYVLAAPVNFTKKSYDAFRSALIDRGVSEFQLLGRAELEDMLYQPKNDRVLFAFFGISLVSRKRTRLTEVRSIVNNKNKLFRALGTPSNRFSVNVLIRDINDGSYPDESAYPDFEKVPRWEEGIAVAHHTEGLRLQVKKHYAYINRERKEWDFVPNLDLLPRRHDRDDEAGRPRYQELHDRATDYWAHMPLENQAKFWIDGLLRYADIDLIDKEGDALYVMPHLYASFSNKGRPFAGYWNNLLIFDEREAVSLKEFKKISFFPKEFGEVTYGKVHEDVELAMPSYLAHRLRDGQHRYFNIENAHKILKQRDVVKTPDPNAQSTDKKYAEVMHKRRAKVSDLLKEAPHLEWEIEQQIGRKPEADEEITVLQLQQVYDFQLERRHKPN